MARFYEGSQNGRKGWKTRKFLGKCPVWWDILYMRRPKRRRDAEKVRAIMKGADPDAISFDLGTRKPMVYFW